MYENCISTKSDYKNQSKDLHLRFDEKNSELKTNRSINDNCMNSPTFNKRNYKRPPLSPKVVTKTDPKNSSFICKPKIQDIDNVRKASSSPNDKENIYIPLVYKSNMIMDSPDPLSKFSANNTAYMNQAMTPISETYDCVETTPFSNKFESKAMGTPMPLIYGSNVTMESPDPLSKFHEIKISNLSPVSTATKIASRANSGLSACIVSPDSKLSTRCFKRTTSSYKVFDSNLHNEKDLTVENSSFPCDKINRGINDIKEKYYHPNNMPLTQETFKPHPPIDKPNPQSGGRSKIGIFSINRMNQ